MTLHECSDLDMPFFCFLNFSAMQSFVAAAHRSGWENAFRILAVGWEASSRRGA